ncbi:MAG TPA: DUF362 domain-containing protein [Verrucomicrobiae bacterium]|nr:DUF362 domain-containing protein [Verrucomicrobiae bacterium]
MSIQRSRVAVLKTDVSTVVEDYSRLARLAGMDSVLSRDLPTLIKLNLSWTKYFPSCSSEPWQVEGAVRALYDLGYRRENLTPVENKTVVTEPWKGARNNRWLGVLDGLGLKFQPLTEVEWTVHRFKSKLLRLNQIFPDGIEIPKMYVGRQILHLPTVKTHGHSTTTGSIKNAFGGLLKEVRHYAHKHIHEVLADLVMMQKEIHPAVFTMMDGTVAGDGAGPRTMIPHVKDTILGAADSVAIDSVAARLMGFDPMKIDYLRICHEMGLGVADPRFIDVVGDSIEGVNFGFKVSRSLVIWGDQMLRRGPLRFLEKVALHSPLVVWAPMASNIYHDWMWYPTVGMSRIRAYRRTKWGKFFDDRYGPGAEGIPVGAAAAQNAPQR